MEKQVKIVIIFDFDGTFYSGAHKFDLVAEKVKTERRKFLPNLTDEQYNQIVKENSNWEKVISGREIVDEICALKDKYPSLPISAKDFWQWQQDNLYSIIIDKNHVTSPRFIKSICQKYPVYLVSNSSPAHLEFYLKKLGMKGKWFKKVISNHFEEFDRTKKHYYADIINDEKVDAKNVLVFGDSDISDLEPGRLLGMKTFFVDEANDLEKIVNNAISQSLD